LGIASSHVRGTEIIVVEQGEPSAARICSELGIEGIVVSDEGRGASRARNIGIRRARGDVVLFTDDDCQVPRDWVRRHLDALSDPEVVASFGEVAGLSKWGDERYDPAALPARHGGKSAPWLIGHSSNMAGLRTALYSVGGFDERLGPGSASHAGGEDADLIVRFLVIVSGTGDAVEHIEWRSSAEDRLTLISYEEGAGVWIGKALRERPRAAMALLRWRLRNLRDYAAQVNTSKNGSIPVSVFAGAFTRGLIAGLRMKPWRGFIESGSSPESLQRGSRRRH
jgi:glycosyltransferase involved in cell wall biosynthesis